MMYDRRPMAVTWLALAATILTCGIAAAGEGSFYKRPALFSTRPSETKSLQTIARFGPVGMGIDLVQPAFTMRIKNIEEGSPAEATGKLKAGQIIETINGQKLADIDPRIQLGQIVSAAEATDGVLKFMVKEKAGAAAEEVVVKIPVLGAYSKTWPLDCPKSDKIVRGFADYLARPGSSPGFGGIGMLFLLSTGEEKDLEVVRRWARGVSALSGHTSWYLGYGGMPLCEYYLRTGDQSVLPAIQRSVDAAEEHCYLGGWYGKSPAIDEETLANDSAMQVIGRLNAENVDIETLRCYAHHQDHGIRRHAAQRAAGLAQNHIGWTVRKSAKPVGDGRLIVELLKSKDARVRRAGVSSIRILPQTLLTDEVFALLVGMISDPEESWWVVDGALETIGLASADRVAPHVDAILPWLKHDDWWLQNSAIQALAPVAADGRCYKKILPVLGDVTLPKGMENWYALDFDPAKAGWKKGRGAFGQYEGKIPQHPIGRCSDTCIGPGCYGATRVNTLWDKEVSLLRGTFRIPPRVHSREADEGRSRPVR